jgi:hypothetical protein
MGNNFETRRICVPNRKMGWEWVGLFDEQGEKHLLSFMHLLRFAPTVH